MVSVANYFGLFIHLVSLVTFDIVSKTEIDFDLQFEFPVDKSVLTVYLPLCLMC